MKLVKYIFFIILLIASIFFLQTFIELNVNESSGNSIMIKIPYLEANHPGFKAWIVFLIVLTAGVIIGFFLALFQIVTYKTESISLRSKLKRVQHELDDMRNQTIDDDLILDSYVKEEID